MILRKPDGTIDTQMDSGKLRRRWPLTSIERVILGLIVFCLLGIAFFTYFIQRQIKELDCTPALVERTDGGVTTTTIECKP